MPLIYILRLYPFYLFTDSGPINYYLQIHYLYLAICQFSVKKIKYYTLTNFPKSTKWRMVGDWRQKLHNPQQYGNFCPISKSGNFEISTSL